MKGSEEMEKLVNCPYWKEYQGMNGWVLFCSAGAFNRKFTRQEAEKIGCTDAQRATCMKIMKSHLGYGLIPELVEEEVKAATAG